MFEIDYFYEDWNNSGDCDIKNDKFHTIRNQSNPHIILSFTGTRVSLQIHILRVCKRLVIIIIL